MRFIFSFIFILTFLIDLTLANDVSLRVGISSMITPVDTVRYYDDIVRYIGKKLGKKVEIVHRKRYEEMNKLIINKGVDIAFICTAAYVNLLESAKIELVAAPVKDEKPFYRSLIIVHKDSNVAKFEDLKGKSFVFVDPLSNTGYVYPLYRLSLMKTNPDNFFTKTSFSYSHNKSIEMVAKKLADGAAVENLIFEFMKQTDSPYVSQVKVIEQSIEFASPPVIVRADFPKELKREIKKVILNMHNDIEGRHILSNMKIKRFDEVREIDYKSVKNMTKYVENRSKSLNNKKLKKELSLIIPDSKNPRILFEKYQPFVDYISKNINMPVQLIIKDHSELRRLIKNGEVDLGFAGVLDFINVEKSGVMNILAIPINKDRSSFYKVALITQKQDIKKIEDLRGKRVGFGPLKSDELNLIPRLMLAKAGIHLSELKKYKHYSYEDTIIKALLKDEIDVGVIRDIHKEKLERMGFKTIAISDEVYYGPFFVNSNLDKNIQKKIEEAIFNIPEEVIKKLDFDLQGGFARADENTYKALENKYKKIPSSCGVKCHPGSRI